MNIQTILLVISITTNVFQAIIFWLVMLGYAAEIKKKEGKT